MSKAVSSTTNETESEKSINEEKREDSEWNFYFGRGGRSNQKRKISKANSLVQNLALRYSYCHQTEKRLFAKNEVYDAVVQNGGRFLLVANKEFTDVTQDKDEVIKRIMQSFRDINKNCRIMSRSDGAKTEPKYREQRRVERVKVLGMEKSDPKRRCIRPSVIEPPIIECARNSQRFMVHEKVHLPTDSQKSINLNLYSRVQCLERIVESMSLKNYVKDQWVVLEKNKAHLSTDSQQSINLKLLSRVRNLEKLVTVLFSNKREDTNNCDGEESNEDKTELSGVPDCVESAPLIRYDVALAESRKKKDRHEKNAFEKSFDAAAGISGERGEKE